MSTACELLQFFRDTHDIVLDYHHRWFRKATIFCDDAKSKLVALFINALNAAGAQGNLDAMAGSVRIFNDRISLLNGKKITFPALMKALTDREDALSEQSIQGLCEHLIGSYKQIGPKKAALFLRDILYVGGEEIFSDIQGADAWPHLIVPVDRVVCDVFNRYLGAKHTPQTLDNELTTRYGRERMFCEDAWFWGHFTIERKRGKVVFCEGGNEALMSLDTVIAGTQRIQDHAPRFVEIVCHSR